MLSDPLYDTPLNIQVPVPASPSNNSKTPSTLTSVPNPSLPNSWFSCNIRVGSITLHLDEENWNKGVVTSEEYDRVTKIFDSLAGKVTKESVVTPGTEPIKVNIGKRLVEKVLKNIQSGIKEADEQEIRELLSDNYSDYVRLKELRGVKEYDEEVKIEESD